MRIGAFSKSNNLSIDTVRYYIDLNLIHPLRKGKYYYFDKDQQEELDRLLHLKKLQFTLEEIKKIMSIEKFDKIEAIMESNVYKDMLLEKKNSIEKDIEGLTKSLKEMDKEINDINEKQAANLKERGILFRNFEMICCPICGSEIELSEGILRSNRIFEGKGQCTCGYCISIDEGIIVVNPNTDNIISPYLDRDEQVDEFVNKTPKSFLDFMIYASEEVIRILLKKVLSNQSLLFMKSALGPLEIMLLQKTSDIGLMIMVDDDLNKLKMAKRSIERNFPESNVLYICSELNELPIKQKSIDIAIDFLATFINGFRVDFNIYEYIHPILKSESSIVGLYLYFKQFNMLSRLEENKRKLFDGSVAKGIKNYHYIETSNYDEVILSEGSNINDFFKDGDKVHAKIMSFHRNVKK